MRKRILAASLSGVIGLSGCGDGSGDGELAGLMFDAGALKRRTMDGSKNNHEQPSWGSAGAPLLRLVPAAYSDGISRPAGSFRPSPREISNAVSAQSVSTPSAYGVTDLFWQWGQFLDHDLDLTATAEPDEPFDIAVPAGDRFFDPAGTGQVQIQLSRSAWASGTGSGHDSPRQQINQITAFIDASNVYGSDDMRAAALRTQDGSGELRVSDGDLMPFNTDGFPNAGGDDDPTLFLGGDVRANEQVGLTAMHTLWVREHNRLARDLNGQIASMSGDDIYARVRAVVGATMQAITYREFLPLLLGPNALRPYEGYRPDVTPGIANVFSAASFRLGHTLLSSSLRRLGSDGRTIPHGDLSLRDAFFAPQRIIAEGGIEPLLRGMAAQAAQDVDLMVVDDVRSFLFGPPGAGGFDLVSLNIQRGRDHGLPDYNTVRAALGLEPARSFADITPDRDLQRRLEAVYGAVNDIDPWVGGLAEAPVPGAMVGELISTVLVDQFERLRDGDRYWYEHVFSPTAVAEIEATRLSDVIRRNTMIGDEIQAEVFRLP